MQEIRPNLVPVPATESFSRINDLQNNAMQINVNQINEGEN